MSFSQFRLPLLAFTSALLWGSAFPVIKIVYSQWETNSFELRLCFAGVRFTLAGLLILPFCFREIRRCRADCIGLLVLLSLTQTCLQYIFFYSGLAVSSGVLGAILVSTGSLWWIVLAPILLKTSRPQRRHAAVVGISMAGVVLAVYAPGMGSGSPVLGGVLFLFASLSGAISAIIIVPLAQRMDVRLATAGALFFGGLVLCLGGMRAFPAFWQLADTKMMWTVLYLAGVSGGAFGIWNWLVQQYSVNVLAGYRFLIPLSGVTQSAVFIQGESLGLGILLGGAMIVGSLVYLHRAENRTATADR